MPKFILFWKNGTTSTLEGNTFTNALVKNGHKLSDVPNIQCYVENGSVDDMTFLQEINQWVKRSEKERV